MRLSITGRGLELDPELRSDLERRFRLGLGSWSSRIRRASVYVEDVNGPKGGLDRRCTIDASLVPAGLATVAGLGTTCEAAVRSATRRLVRRMRDEMQRRRMSMRSPLWARGGQL
jgi:putative sigma-54 modulation protein